jgi:hypothetical protein
VDANVAISLRRFSDVGRDHWGWGAVQIASTHGILQGYGGYENATFGAGDKLSREQMATVLVKVLDLEYDPDPESSPFADVDDDDKFLPFIISLKENGITVGCAVNPLRYCPKGETTRAQFATFLKRGLGLSTDVQPTAFQDLDGLNPAMVESIHAVAAKGLMNGCSSVPLRFCPNDKITRVQAAAVVRNVLLDRAGGPEGP